MACNCERQIQQGDNRLFAMVTGHFPECPAMDKEDVLKAAMCFMRQIGLKERDELVDELGMIFWELRGAKEKRVKKARAMVMALSMRLANG